MLACLFIISSMIGQPAAAPLELVEAKPLPALTKRFHQTDGWTGGDGAQSFVLGPDRTLWLFADSWIGKIENGKRVGSRMINNTAAWQSLKKPDEPMRFFWAKADKGPDALLKPEQKDAWYWPGDGALVDGKLYLFCKVVRQREKGEPGFQFDWFQNEFLQIGNPQEQPSKWKLQRYRLSDDAGQLRLGVACVMENDYLYAFGLFPEKQCKPFDSPLAVARLAKSKLARMDRNDWEHWCETDAGPAWSKQPAKLVPLFRDAPAEFTVTKVRGIPGYVATYTKHGLGRDIAVRHAMRPEGPWSKPLVVYQCPEKDKKIFQYGAKAHAELAEREGQLIVTYCRNIGSLAEHVNRPEIYFPQGVEVQLRWNK
jgi:Domain of unknown function (DUF4185)